MAQPHGRAKAGPCQSDVICLESLDFGAGDEIRTHDPNLGKVVLYP